MLPYYAVFCCLMLCGDAFVLLPISTYLTSLSTDTTAAAEGAVRIPAKFNSSPNSSAQILDAQAIAEAQARIAFDAFAMNALFVNVDERPEPVACTISVDSPTSQLPSDLPPGCLLRIGPNGANINDGFLDGDGLVHAITLPPHGQGDVMYSATYVDTKGRKLERATAYGKTFAGTLGSAPEGLPMLANFCIRQSIQSPSHVTIGVQGR